MKKTQKEVLERVYEDSQKIGMGVIRAMETVALMAEALRDGFGDSAYIASTLELVHDQLFQTTLDKESRVDGTIEELIEAAELQAEAEIQAETAA